MTIEVTLRDIRELVGLARLDAAAYERGTPPRRAAREAIRSRLPERVVERYDTLLGTGRMPVLAGIEGECCSACHLRLPTMLAQRARRSPAVHTCPCCRRMIYAPELLGERTASADPAPAPARSRRSRGVNAG